MARELQYDSDDRSWWEQQLALLWKRLAMMQKRTEDGLELTFWEKKANRRLVRDFRRQLDHDTGHAR